MHICIITTEFVTESYFSGGIAQQFYRIAKWEIARGHRVKVITLSDRNEVINYDGINVHRVVPSWPFIIRAVNKLSYYKFSSCLRWLTYSWAAYRKAKELHRQNRFDIVHSVHYQVCGLATLLFLRLPHVVFAAGYKPVWNELSGVRRYISVKAGELLELCFYRLAKNIFAPSVTLKNMLAEKANIKNVRVIRTPFYQEIRQLDDSVYKQYLGGKDYLLFFGRLQMHKGAHILGQALAEVFSKLPRIYAAFVGLDASSPLGPSMRRYITQKCDGSTERVIFIDALHHERLYPIIKGTRLVVLPSLIDNLPNTMLEAMGLGKPVLGTIGCSFDEIIEDGKNGFLVNPGNPTELAQKIVEVWNRKDLDEIGRSAARKIEELAPDKVVPQLIDYYQEVIDANKSR